MELRETKRFRKAFSKQSPKRRLAIRNAVKAFQENRESAALRDHELKGKKKHLRAFSAGGDLRVIYREEGDFVVVILLDTGSHNQVYS